MENKKFFTKRIEVGILIKLHDNRYDAGFNIKTFETKEVTSEVVDYVKRHHNAYYIDLKGGSKSLSRDEFLLKYGEIRNIKRTDKEQTDKRVKQKKGENIKKSNRKEITNFLGNLLEKEKFGGIGKYWAKEVSIDANSINCKRVDYMQFIPKDQCSISSIEKGIFVCYEIKSCIEDVYSGNGLNFLGEKNYIVTTADCYKQLNEDIKSGKFDKFMLENHPDSSLYFGIIVAVPNYRDLKDELKNPTPLDADKKWSLMVAKPCREGSRKRSITELLFCMLRSGKGKSNV